MIQLPIITDTAEIEAYLDPDDEHAEPVKVYMDFHVSRVVPGNWANDYETSDPYREIGPKRLKVKVNLTPMELAELETAVKEMADKARS